MVGVKRGYPTAFAVAAGIVLSGCVSLILPTTPRDPNVQEDTVRRSPVRGPLFRTRF
jgi:hypothetical protein